ncbi:hypothetical protein GJAV_G00067820 [Gymnothorax javanicus]|nr:hypothetical protein GJAV_G00067820 [Gymnothorax javanicus]
MASLVSSRQPRDLPTQGSRPPEKLYVGSVGHLPLVGTSADMVNGFIALLKGDLQTAKAKGYNDFLNLAGIRDLKPGAILQNHKGQAVMGCSAEVSKKIIEYLIQVVGPKAGASAAIKDAKAAQEGEQLRRNLTASFEALRAKLREKGVDLERDVAQNRRSGRGEHVFNNALLGLYGSIVDSFIDRHVTGGSRVALVARIPNSRVSDAFQGHAQDGVHINLTADQRRNIRSWVVHIPDNVVYTPINNILFAYMTDTVRVNAIDYMHLYRQGQNNVNVMNMLARSVEWMNTHRVYLDPEAAQIWFAENPRLAAQFYQTEDAVQLMLRHLDPQRSTLLREFVEDLRQAGAQFH